MVLEPNDDVVSPTLVVTKKTPSGIWTKDLYSPEGRFYQGYVTSDPHSHVAVRELQGDGKLVRSLLMNIYNFNIL